MLKDHADKKYLKQPKRPAWKDTLDKAIIILAVVLVIWVLTYGL